MDVSNGVVAEAREREALRFWYVYQLFVFFLLSPDYCCVVWGDVA